MKLAEHAEAVGCEMVYDSVTGMAVREDGAFSVMTSAPGPLRAPAVVYTAGATPRPAGFEGEEQFRGRGVSYCATCDGMFYRGKDVYVIGGGTAACEEALFLSRIVRSVTMVVRRDVLRTTPKLREQGRGMREPHDKVQLKGCLSQRRDDARDHNPRGRPYP